MLIRRRYDSDRNGYLDKLEIEQVIASMLDLLGSANDRKRSASLSDECLKELDVSRDGKVSKGKRHVSF